MFGGLNCIGSLASGDLCKDSMLISSRELGRVASERGLMIGKEILKHPRDSRLANAKFGSNMMSGGAIRSQRKDVFFFSRGDGAHCELRGPERISLDYIAGTQAQVIPASP